MPDLTKLYTTHWKSLCKQLQVRFGSGPPDPQDIAQDAFQKLSEQFEKGKAIENPKAFLFRTAHNLVIDHHRSPRNTYATEKEIEFFEEHANTDVSSPENVLINRQELNIVSDVIMSLPERDRAFVLMNRLENMTYTEIAKQANMSRSGVQLIITKALDKCMQTLNKASKGDKE